MRIFGWTFALALHVAAIVALEAQWRAAPPPELGEAAVVPIEVVTTADDTNIRAARNPDIAQIAPEPQDAGAPQALPDPIPPEPIPALEPVPKPPPPPPPRRREPTLDLNALDSVLRDARDRDRGNAAQDATPAGEPGAQARASQGLGTGLSASQRARIAALLRAAIEQCGDTRTGQDRAQPLTAVYRIRLDRTGALVGRPEIVTSSGDRPFDESGMRALQLCGPYDLGDLQDAATREPIRFNYSP